MNTTALEKNKIILSIIIVTWNNENFIEQALSSCIVEGVDDYEVVVVHNASDDRTGELIRRSIKGYENIFSVVENEKNEGLGQARNIGIDQARGEYFIFLDGDDWFETEKLIELINKLNEKKPDVLFYDYQRVWDTGWKKRNQLGHLLYEHDASDIIERNKILNVFCIACNKAYRKSFIEDIFLKFPVGYYEDVPWTYTVLLKAKSIYVTPFVILNYRQRVGSILKSTDERHLILPQRYNKILKLFEKDIDLSDKYGKTLLSLVRAHLFARPVWSRLPRKVRSQYLKDASNTLKEWRSLLQIDARDSTLFIAQLGLPLLYTLGKEAAPTKKKIKNKIQKYSLWVYKKIFCKLPIDNKKIYLESYWGNVFDCNPKGLYEYLVDNTEYKVFVGLKKEAVWPQEIKRNIVRIGSLRYWYIVATSRLLITNTNLRAGVVKRKESIHLQTHHGTPLKKVGIDTRNNEYVKMNWKAYAVRCRRWDYLLSSNPYSSSVWRRATPFNYKVIEAGYPRNDILLNSSDRNIENIKSKLAIEPDKKVVLYAPTYRDMLHKNNDLFKELVCLFESCQDTVFLIRDHHLSENELISKSKSSGNIKNVSNHGSINDLYLVSDVLITDYSSTMFDFAVLKRPIILFQYDYFDYIKDRGVYFDIRSKAPGAVVDTLVELREALNTKSYENSENQKKLAAFNKEFCPWDDGHSAERIINKILG